MIIEQKEVSESMRNTHGVEIKPRKTSSHHRFQVVVVTFDEEVPDRDYATLAAARKRVSILMSDDNFNPVGFSYLRVEELFI